MKIGTVRNMCAAVACASVMMLPTAPARAGNIVQNGGFEDGLNGWTVITAGMGSNVGLINQGMNSPTALRFASTGGYDAIEQALPWSPGDQVRIELWLLNYGAGEDGLAIGFRGDNGGDSLVDSPVGAPLEDWTFISIDWAVPMDLINPRLRIEGFDANASLLIDDISVTIIPAPEVTLVLAAGVLGLRRRRAAA